MTPESEAPDSAMAKLIKRGKDNAKYAMFFGAVLFVGSLVTTLSGEFDSVEITCTRSDPESTVDCAVLRHLFGHERVRHDIPNVLATSYRYHPPTRGKIVYVETPQSDSIYLETTEEGAFLQLSAFLEDKSRRRFERKTDSLAVAAIVGICLGLVLALFGLFKWRQWTRKRLF